jgi:DNA-binding transcriptional ArsR family regulator
MLAALFGNPTAEKVLMFLALNGDGYAQEIADRFALSLSMVQNQLIRLQRGGVLVSIERGRMRFFSFNPRFRFADEIVAMLRRAADYLPERDRDRFLVRRRPRAR